MSTSMTNELHPLVIFLHDWAIVHVPPGQPPPPIQPGKVVRMKVSHTLRFVNAAEASELIYALSTTIFVICRRSDYGQPPTASMTCDACLSGHQSTIPCHQYLEHARVIDWIHPLPPPPFVVSLSYDDVG